LKSVENCGRQVIDVEPDGRLLLKAIALG
jgi:hypothetical protein